jgi:hypothetical protein
MSGRDHTKIANQDSGSDDENAPVLGASSNSATAAAASTDDQRRVQVPVAQQPQWSANFPQPDVDDATAVRLEYHRLALSRFGMVTCVAAVALLFFTPIVGLLLLPSTIMALYWLRNSVRFQHGGDSRRCSNRDCSFSFMLVMLWTSLVICVLTAMSLGYTLSQPKTGTDEENQETHKGHYKVHTPYHAAALALSLMTLPLILFNLHHLRALRRLLESTPHLGGWHAGAAAHDEAIEIDEDL